MIDIWLKHKVCEYCINIVFNTVFKNFILPQIIPSINISYNFSGRVMTISDGKNKMRGEFDIVSSSKEKEVTLIIDFFGRYYPNVLDVIMTGDFEIETSEQID